MHMSGLPTWNSNVGIIQKRYTFVMKWLTYWERLQKKWKMHMSKQFALKEESYNILENLNKQKRFSTAWSITAMQDFLVFPVHMRFQPSFATIN